MTRSYLQIHQTDNIIAALTDLPQGTILHDINLTLIEDIPAKHKFAIKDFAVGEPLYMYGVIIGEAKQTIAKGSRISTDNTTHAVQEYQVGPLDSNWDAPDVKGFREQYFMGYHRANGTVGTMNYWIVVPLVFCENRNLTVIEKAMLEELGYASNQAYHIDIKQLAGIYQKGGAESEILEADIVKTAAEKVQNRLFQHVDGIKFLYHEGGCGCTRQDSDMLCKLIAGYINNPNVAGATVLSLGCQNAQASVLKDALNELDPNSTKPVYMLEQQQSASEPDFIAEAVKKTFLGLIEANKIQRRPAPLSQLCIGLECGGSDGFSGISANPTLGHTSDLLVALGGSTILSEFPELNGVEQELVNRCTSKTLADKFSKIMHDYARRAEADGSSFAMNPSPGNIRDGLITDAMKSAGAAKKRRDFSYRGCVGLCRAGTKKRSKPAVHSW